MVYITHSEMLGRIRETVNAIGSQKLAAKSMGISEQFLSDVLKGRRDISESLASKFGYRRTVRFCKRS